MGPLQTSITRRKPRSTLTLRSAGPATRGSSRSVSGTSSTMFRGLCRTTASPRSAVRFRWLVRSTTCAAAVPSFRSPRPSKAPETEYGKGGPSGPPFSFEGKEKRDLVPLRQPAHQASVRRRAAAQPFSNAVRSSSVMFGSKRTPLISRACQPAASVQPSCMAASAAAPSAVISR